jgi:RimJ/RimL family protein N-acetyltransferase
MYTASVPITTESLLNDPNPWTAPAPLPGPIETERLVLRFHEHGDAASMLDALDLDRDALLPWIVWVRTENRTVAECHYTIERFRRQREDRACTNFTMGIFDRATGALVGGTGLQNIRPGQRDAEVGYWIRSDRHGKGLATEATGALITAAVRPQAEGGWGFRRIVAACGAQNVASAAVLHKLGLRLELRGRQEQWVDGLGYFDTLRFAVLAEEWDAGRRCAKAGIGWDDPAI